MKTIQLISIELNNFMGVQHKLIELNNKITSLVGANATGKTTVATAFRWLLFNKDITDRSDFEIKTLDYEGKVKHYLEHKVEAIIQIYETKNQDQISIEGAKNIKLTKIYKEIWRKKRGAEEETFSGHETLYYIDDVPMLKKDYDKELDEIISENQFKVITDPLFFSEKLHWKDARNILLDITGDIEDSEIINKNDKLKNLDTKGKKLDDFRKMVKEQRNKLNNELDKIPIRIDEVSKTIKYHNFDEVNSELLECQREIREIIKELDKPIIDEPSRIIKKKKLAEIKEKIYDIENNRLKEFNKSKQDLFDKTKIIEEQALQSRMKAAAARKHAQDLQEEIQRHEQKLIDLRRQWNEQNEEEFKADIETICPVCKQEIPEEDLKEKLEEMIKHFNNDKAEKLEWINKKGKDLSNTKQSYETALKNYNDEIRHYEEEGDNLLKELEIVKSKITALQPEEKEIDELNDFKELAKNLETELEEEDSYTEAMKLRAMQVDRKSQLTQEIDELKEVMQQKKINEEAKERIEQLKIQQKEIAAKIANIEKQEYLSDEYIKTKVELLEDRINKRFKFVSFRLFETQINGAINEVCKPTINGVPFSDANRASKINAGIDIINSLSKHYEVSAPIWIDNRESITELIDTDSQIINLIVDPNFPTLKAISADNSLEEQVRFMEAR